MEDVEELKEPSDEQRHYLCSSVIYVSVIKSRSMGRRWHVAPMGRSPTLFLDLRGALFLSIPGLSLRQCIFISYCISFSDYKELR
jgi:hypothetical protein